MGTHRIHTRVPIRIYIHVSILHIHIYCAQVEYFCLYARYKVSLNSFSDIVLVSTRLSDHNAIKLENINKKTKSNPILLKCKHTFGLPVRKGGVGKCCAHLLPQPHQWQLKYRTFTEVQLNTSLITEGLRGSLLRLQTQNGPVPHSNTAAKNLSAVEVTPEESQPHKRSPSPGSQWQEEQSHSLWLVKTSEDQWLSIGGSQFNSQ